MFSKMQPDGERFLCQVLVDDMGAIHKKMCCGARVKDGVADASHGCIGGIY